MREALAGTLGDSDTVHDGRSSDGESEMLSVCVGEPDAVGCRVQRRERDVRVCSALDDCVRVAMGVTPERDSDGELVRVGALPTRSNVMGVVCHGTVEMVPEQRHDVSVALLACHWPGGDEVVGFSRYDCPLLHVAKSSGELYPLGVLVLPAKQSSYG